jgi:hypothetical protein
MGQEAEGRTTYWELGKHGGKKTPTLGGTQWMRLHLPSPIFENSALVGVGTTKRVKIDLSSMIH